jgi:hypothetical protein
MREKEREETKHIESVLERKRDRLRKRERNRKRKRETRIEGERY